MRGLAILCGLLVALSLPLPPAAALDAETASSIGRLNYAGFKEQQHCTAFLVAPQVAMTAAHCLDGLEPDQVHLLLGYDRGGWQEHLRADGFWRSPDGKDLAALCLTQPAQAVPLAVTAGEVAPGEELAVLGYGLPSVHLCRAGIAWSRPTRHGTAFCSTARSARALRAGRRSRGPAKRWWP